VADMSFTSKRTIHLLRSLTQRCALRFPDLLALKASADVRSDCFHGEVYFSRSDRQSWIWTTGLVVWLFWEDVARAGWQACKKSRLIDSTGIATILLEINFLQIRAHK